MKVYPALAIANAFLDCAEKEERTMSPLKIQKLVYIAHGWHLGILDSPLIAERIEVWRWGPVISSIYHEFKHFGNQAITGRGTIPKKVGYGEYKRGMDIEFVEPRIDENDEIRKKFIERVWELYGKYTGIQLSNLTHDKDTPWYKAKSDDQAVIDDAAICEYYKNLAKSE